MQSMTQQLPPQSEQGLSPEVAQQLLNELPDKIKFGLLTYAAQLNQPIENLLEMAIAKFLDEDAVSFANCQPIKQRPNY